MAGQDDMGLVRDAPEARRGRLAVAIDLLPCPVGGLAPSEQARVPLQADSDRASPASASRHDPSYRHARIALPDS